MKTYKQFKSGNKESILSYPSSFGEVRDKDDSVLSWDSSFGELEHRQGPKRPDKSKVDEAFIKKGGPEWSSTTIIDHEHHTGFNDKNASYNKEWHHHPDNEPQNLSKEHLNSIHSYTHGKSEHFNGHGSSGNMNGYLRNLSGEKNQGIRGGHSEYDVRNSIRQFSSTFTPENTNKKPITTYGGVPEHIGRKLSTSRVGSKHTLAGFTSTSISKATAKSYGNSYNPSNNRKIVSTHVVKYNVEPGAGLSVAPHSRYSENEVILNHGSHITYHGSTRHRDENGERLIVHHVTVHPTSKPLESYKGTYKHPKGME